MAEPRRVPGRRTEIKKGLKPPTGKRFCFSPICSCPEYLESLSQKTNFRPSCMVRLPLAFVMTPN